MRAMAAFLVFTWHFIHVNNGQQAAPPMFPLSVLAEGHTGVSLFMVLSGYLFAKLLDGKNVNYTAFLWNRMLRLLPLLVFVLLIAGLQQFFIGGDIVAYAKKVVWGVVKPTLPNGAWSITAEFHFYLVLPLLLLLTRQWKYSLVLVILIAILFRIGLYWDSGEIQRLSAFTIVGRIDQFLLGIMAFQFRPWIRHNHFLAAVTLGLFAIFYWYFDAAGGFYMNVAYPSPSAIWIVMPTIEGIAYAILIAWYDNSFTPSQGPISPFLSRIGIYSYSIYLLHFFFVFDMAAFINNHIIPLNDLYLAMAFSVFAFLFMLPISYLSYTFIEKPFLKYRTQYIVETAEKEATVIAGKASNL